MLPSPATIRWSSSSSLIGAVRPANRSLQIGRGRSRRPAAPAPAPRTAASRRCRRSRTQVERAEPARVVERQPTARRRSRSADGRACRARPDRPASGPTCRGGRPACRRDRSRSGRISRGDRGRSRARRSAAGQVVRERPAQIGAARRRRAVSRRPSSTWRKPAHGGLDFGKLRHRGVDMANAAAKPARGPGHERHGQFRLRSWSRPEEKTAPRRRGLHQRRAQLRRDERPDVRRACTGCGRTVSSAA